MSEKLTDAQLIASAMLICEKVRDILKTEGLSDDDRLTRILVQLSGQLTYAHGTLICLATNLEQDDEVRRILDESADRLKRIDASAGLRGRA